MRALYFIALALCGILSSCSTSSFFYYPDQKIVHYPDTSIYKLIPHSFISESGNILLAWEIRKTNMKEKGFVLMLHGNAGNLGSHFKALLPLADSGFTTFLFDYSGYGHSGGIPSQENVLLDARSALNYCKGIYNGENFILFGQSLGGHLAVCLAAEQYQKLKALVVEGAFSGHEEIAAYHGKKSYHSPAWLTKIFVPSKYNALESVKKLKIPVIFIHSTEDEVCPYPMSEALYRNAPEPKKLWTIKGKHIRAAIDYRAEFIQQFLSLTAENKSP